ncbi:MAG: tetratricopeptide repeat protein [Bacteroidia bacterium]|nr:tetratricopeptide repeat protein [Bacteroidia bacterium]
MRTCLILVLLAAGICARSQPQTDSLRQAWSNPALPDSSRVDALDELAFFYQERQPDSALYFAEQLYAFGQARQSPRALALALGHQGRYHARKGDYGLAETLYRQAIQIWKDQGNPRGIAGVLGKLGIMHYLRGDYEQALACFQQNLALSDSLGMRQEAAGMLLNIGSIRLYQSKYDEALDYFVRSLTRFEEMGDIARQATVLGNIGIVHNDRGDYAQALAYYRRSLALHDSADNPLGMAQTLGNMGLIYNYQGDYRQALDHYQRSIGLFQSMDNQMGIAINLGNIGMIYYAQKDYVRALDYHQRSLAINEKLENKRGIAATLNNIGDVYFDQKDLTQALSYYQRSLDIHQSLNDQSSVAKLQQNLGNVYRAQGLGEKALANYLSSLAIHESLKDQQGIADVATSLGEFYHEAGNYARASYYGEKALPRAREAGAVQEIANAARLLYKSYKSSGQDRNALPMLELYHQMRDSLNSEENQRAAIRFEYQQQALADSLTNAQEKAVAQLAYENQLRQQRLQLAFAGGAGLLVASLALVLFRSSRRRQQTNRLLSAQNEQIQAKSQQNELLLKEIHHRVKNSLQTISSLLYLQSAHIKDEEVRQAVAAGQHRVESMALIHQKLYQRDTLAAIEMKDYLSNLATSLVQTFAADPGRIRVNLDMPELELDVDTAVPLGLIVNELITNSLKYAFPDGRQGAITVSLRQTGEQLELLVADDGVGSANTATGTAFGSQLVQLLTAQLGGEIRQDTTAGYTTRLLIS